MKLRTVADFNLIVQRDKTYIITPQGVEIPDEIARDILEREFNSVEEVKENG